MSQFEYDLLVIGAGSGGVRAARTAASMGKNVAVVEDTYLGGTCVNVGCVPKKLFVYGAHFSEEFKNARGFGWNPEKVSFDWPTLRDNKNTEIKRLNGIYENLLKNSGVNIINGKASFVDSHTVSVAEKHYTAKHILIATGGAPVVPEFPGSEHVITSNEAFYLNALPEKIIIVGGGYIAIEFAGIFNGLGVETHLFYRGAHLLRGFDQDIQHFIESEIVKKGIHLHLNTNIKSIEKRSDRSLQARLTSGENFTAERIMYATGRKPRIEGLVLENTSVKLTSSNAIEVNHQFQTNDPSIYALGDVIGGIQLTPIALAEAMALVRHLFEGKPIALDYDNIPTAVFSQPNIATVGLTQQQAEERGINILVFKSEFRHMKHTLSGGNERTFMKLVVDQATDKVLGCHMVGADAGEIIQGLAVAIKAGATKADFDQTIGIHPTAAEEFVTMREPTSV